MTTRNNDLLYNSALAGSLAGQVGSSLGSGQAPTVAADYAEQLETATAYAAAVDAAIAFDSTLSTSSSNPAPIQATNGTLVGNQMAKCQLLESLSRLAWQNRNNPGASTAPTAIVSAVAAAYAEGITGIFTT